MGMRKWETIRRTRCLAEIGMRGANAYTDGASTGTRGPGGFGAVLTWKGKTGEISGGKQDTNLRMELTAACVAPETIDKMHRVTVYPDASYLVNCMGRGWRKRWRENGWLDHRRVTAAYRDLGERFPGAAWSHREVRWRGKGTPEDRRGAQGRKRQDRPACRGRQAAGPRRGVGGFG